MRAKWTEEKIEYLKNSWGKTPIKKIAKNLNVTERSVATKASVIGLGNQIDYRGYITKTYLAKCLGSDSHKVDKFIENGLKTINSSTSTKFGRQKLIDINDFWEWAEQNKEMINFRKIERGLLLPEPTWLDEAMKQEYQFDKTMWTIKEIKRLVFLLNKDLSRSDIAKELNRTRSGVNAKIQLLRDTNKLIQRWELK